MIKMLLIFNLFLLIAPKAMAENFSYDHERNTVISYYSDKKFNSWFVEDKNKTLSRAQAHVEEWIKRDEFIKSWGITEEAMPSVSERDQQRFVIKQLSRYSERRVKAYWQEKNKNKEKRKNLLGETFAKNQDKEFYFSYSTILLKGRARLEWHNPYAEVFAQYSFSDKDEVICAKNIDWISARSRLLYAPLRNLTEVSLERPIYDTVMARIAMVNFKESKVELSYSYNF